MLLRDDPGVKKALSIWWSTAQRSLGETDANKADVLLDFEAYTAVSRKIYKAMIEEYDVQEAMASAKDDWESDRRGADALDQDLFALAIFELADM